MKFFPDRKEHGWVPYLWLFFLLFVLFEPAYSHASARRWALTLLGVAVFLILYFALYAIKGRKRLLIIAAFAGLGLIFAPYNGGACTFFIYAAALTPFVTESTSESFKCLGGLLGVILAGALLVPMPSPIWITALVVSIPIGLSNTFFAQKHRDDAKLRMAQDEIEHLAKIAERERIARDLHDVLGHTLSLITLKSELAGKLIDRDPARAKEEIRAVEATARQALSEVRQAVVGYRAKTLTEEIKLAKSTLETAGVRVDCEAASVPLQPAQESVLGLALREAVTNVVRHARAHTCRLRLAQTNGHCLLEIEDDGRGGTQTEGNGLRGMRERVEAVGGHLERSVENGTKLLITVPVEKTSGTN
jgi:two-component system, NarL family, sensor histidine kinase DesK